MPRRVTSAHDHLPILEAEKFEEQVGGDSELMIEIIDLFLGESKKDAANMAACVESGEWEELSKIAHTIKGSLASLHAMRARASAQDLETSAKKKDAAVSVRAYHQLVQDLRVLGPELLDLRDSVASLN